MKSRPSLFAIVLSSTALIAISNPAAAAFITIPGVTGQTGNYTNANSLGTTISGDTALYLVTTMTISNLSGSLKDTNTYIQTSFFNGGSERVGVGSPPNGATTWGLMGVGNQESAETIVLGQPTVMVLKLDQVSGDIKFWVNPDLSGAEPATADLSFTNTAQAKGDVTSVNLRGGSYGGQTNDNVVDYANVAVYYSGSSPFIPEPATSLLASFGALVLLRRRR